MRILQLVYLNITFYLFFVIFSLVAVPGLGTFIILGAAIWPHRQVLKRLRRAIVWYGAVIIRILPNPLVRIDYKNFSGSEGQGPFIFVSNHRSSSDPFLMACPCLAYEAIQVVNIWPFRLPILGLVAKAAGYLSVRQLPFEDFLVKTTRLLKQGVSVIVFPEGTRSRDNAVGQFHGAIFRVALETGKPIVPICITGNENIPPIGSLLLRPGVIKIHRLKELPWEEYAAFSPYKLKNHVRQIISDEVANMERCA